MKYQKGQSGNPRGRPRKTTTLAAFRSSVANAVPEIIKTLIELAKAGDVAAAKLLLDRAMPALKPQTVPVNIPIAGSLADQGNEIIKATMTGTIPPDIGSLLLAALASQAKIVEIDDLIRRIDILESKNS